MHIKEREREREKERWGRHGCGPPGKEDEVETRGLKEAGSGARRAKGKREGEGGGGKEG